MAASPSIPDSLAFRYHLWRKHEHRRVLNGFYPEILATDGHTVRRLLSQDRKLLFQEFPDKQVANTIISRIEEAAGPGVQMMGYKRSENAKSVAILQTGPSAQAPGWLAFPYSSHTLEFEDDPTIPFQRAMMMPQDSILGGARVAWRSGSLELQLALEQRKLPESLSSLDLLAYIEDVEVCALSYKRGEPKIMDLSVEDEGSVQLKRPYPFRLEGRMSIEPSIFKAFQRTDSQLWIKMKFSREMFCLPDTWRSFWIEVDVADAGTLHL